MRREQALEVAKGLVEAFRPECHRVEIAGSIRRGVAEVSDIEIVAEPVMTPQLDLFGDLVGHFNELEGPLVELVASDWEFVKQGTRYCQMVSCEGVKLDLFMVHPPAQWGVIYTIRTGPAAFSHWCVSRRSFGGAMPLAHQMWNGGVYRGIERQPLPMPEEIDFLEFLGLGWIEPAARMGPVGW